MHHRKVILESPTGKPSDAAYLVMSWKIWGEKASMFVTMIHYFHTAPFTLYIFYYSWKLYLFPVFTNYICIKTRLQTPSTVTKSSDTFYALVIHTPPCGNSTHFRLMVVFVFFWNLFSQIYLPRSLSKNIFIDNHYKAIYRPVRSKWSSNMINAICWRKNRQGVLFEIVNW